ncbi:MAG TPA: ADOP family duplicated permease [Gemmatimonadaceae bacterium]|nr:ADOP family duplicated permease [Gemmatimonadaceae bacterium]
MDTLRYAFRSLRRTPGFAAAAVIVLAIGIGANATMFGVIDRLLLRPPPLVVDPDRIVRVYVHQQVPGIGDFTTATLAFPDYVDYRDRDRDFSAVAAFSGGNEVAFGRGRGARTLRANFVSRSYFPLLGVRPALGRFFAADEDDPARPVRVAVLDHGFWESQFGGDPAVLGRQLALGEDLYTVVGVAPAGFTGVNLSPVDVWIPLAAADPLAASAEAFTSRNWQWIEVVGRLRDGATLDAAQATATGIRRQAYADAGASSRSGGRGGRRIVMSGGGGGGASPAVPSERREADVVLGPVLADRGPERSRAATVSLWLGGVAVIVLLVACANVANLLLVRALRRRREIAVRVALGISSMRLALQLGAEALLLAIGGGALGLFVAALGSRLLQRVLLADSGVPLGLDARVLAFTAAAAALTALLCGLVRVLQASAPDVATALKSGTREGGAHSHRRLRDGLVVAQVALTIVLLVGAGLFVRSLRHALTLDLGIDPSRLVVAEMSLSDVGYNRREIDATFRRMLDRIAARPEVEAAGMAVSVPFRNMFAQRIRIPGRDSLPRPARGRGPFFNGVTGDYLAAAGIAVKRGRGITDADVGAGAPVVVVNEALAKLYWPGEDPIGRCLVAGRDSTGPCRTVVGVVENAAMTEIRDDPPPQLYMPLPAADTTMPPMRALFVRSRAAGPHAAADLVPVVRSTMLATAADLPYANVRPFADLYSPQVRPWQLGATMFSLFGGAALLLAVVGLYAVLSYSVSQRTHEIGVRMALGARGGDVVRVVVGQGMRVAALGLFLGAAGAWAGSRFVRDQLFGVSGHDPIVFTVVALTLLLVAAAASWLPARRAAGVDPVEALRAE